MNKKVRTILVWTSLVGAIASFAITLDDWRKKAGK